MNSIFIAAHARSGSTYLCRLMEKISQVRVYLEIFHFNYDIIDQHLQGDLAFIEQKMSLSADKSEARGELIRRHHEYVSLLKELNPQKAIAFKVFPKHLPDKVLGEVIGDAGLIVLLRRNLLHSYISDVISMKTQKWAGVDTSREKVEFIQEDFVRHVQRVVDYYGKVISFADRFQKKLVFLGYETLAMSANPLQMVSNALSCGLDHALDAESGEIKISKQDKRTRATEKVLNAEEMVAFLEKFDLGILNDGLVNCTDPEYAGIK